MRPDVHGFDPQNRPVLSFLPYEEIMHMHTNIDRSLVERSEYLTQGRNGGGIGDAG
jgi:hypothetical protein